MSCQRKHDNGHDDDQNEAIRTSGIQARTTRSWFARARAAIHRTNTKHTNTNHTKITSKSTSKRKHQHTTSTHTTPTPKTHKHSNTNMHDQHTTGQTNTHLCKATWCERAHAGWRVLLSHRGALATLSRRRRGQPAAVQERPHAAAHDRIERAVAVRRQRQLANEAGNGAEARRCRVRLQCTVSKAGGSWVKKSALLRRLAMVFTHTQCRRRQQRRVRRPGHPTST